MIIFTNVYSYVSYSQCYAGFVSDFILFYFCPWCIRNPFCFVYFYDLYCFKKAFYHTQTETNCINTEKMFCYFCVFFFFIPISRKDKSNQISISRKILVFIVVFYLSNVIYEYLDILVFQFLVINQEFQDSVILINDVWFSLNLFIYNKLLLLWGFF